MTVRFSDFEFDPASLNLRCRGQTVALKPQAGALLNALIEASPAPVTRETLIASLWPAATVADFDQSLNAGIRQIRQALAPHGHKLIETLPRRGYRFTGEVRQPVRWRTFLIAGLVLGIVMIGFAMIRTATRPPAQAASERMELVEARRHLAAGNEAGLEHARQAFAAAAMLNPDSAEARGGYALATVLLAGRNGRDWQDWTQRGQALARDAVASDPGNVMATTALAFVALYRDWDPSAANSLIRPAIAAGDFSPALALGANIAAALGNTGQATRLADRAVLVAPLSGPAMADRCWHYLFAGEADLAVRACRQSRQALPQSVAVQIGLANALEGAGRVSAALALLDEDVASPPPTIGPALDAPARWKQLGCRRADARLADGLGGVLTAAFLVQCGRAEAALDQLETACAARESGVLFMLVDPRFRRLRAEPRFAALAEIDRARHCGR